MSSTNHELILDFRDAMGRGWSITPAVTRGAVRRHVVVVEYRPAGKAGAQRFQLSYEALRRFLRSEVSRRWSAAAAWPAPLPALQLLCEPLEFNAEMMWVGDPDGACPVTCTRRCCTEPYEETGSPDSDRERFCAD